MKIPPILSQHQHWLPKIWYGVLFLCGSYLWGWFLNWGCGLTTYHDWAEITAPRMTFLQKSMQQGVLPLHISDPFPLGNITLRFMSIPDVILSPQIILLRYIEISTFILLDTWLMYSLGFLGLLLLARKFRLSPLAFTILFVLHNFNGHLLAHYSVGHLTWGGNFLFSWIVLLIFERLDNDGRSWQWATKMGLLCFLIFLQGSYHQFVWILIFLGLFGLMIPKHFGSAAKAGILAVLFSMVRILPPMLLLEKFSEKFEFSAGYPLFQSMWRFLTKIQLPYTINDPNLTKIAGSWELTIYVGALGAIFLIYFGILKPLLHSSRYSILLLPVAGLAFLSLDKTYALMRTSLPLPLLTGERVAARMISLAFAFVLTLAVIEFQQWLTEKNFSFALMGILAIGVLSNTYDLWRNLLVWQVLNAEKEFHYMGFEPDRWQVMNNYLDKKYVLMLSLGLLISCASLIFSFVKARKEKHLESQMAL